MRCHKCTRINPYTRSFAQCVVVWCLGSSVAGMPGQVQGKVPIVRMFGVTDDGNSVCCHIHGFAPYFYVSAPNGELPITGMCSVSLRCIKHIFHDFNGMSLSFLGFTNAHLAEFQRELNSAVLKDMRSNKDNIAITVLAVDITKKESKSS